MPQSFGLPFYFWDKKIIKETQNAATNTIAVQGFGAISSTTAKPYATALNRLALLEARQRAQEFLRGGD